MEFLLSFKHSRHRFQWLHSEVLVALASIRLILGTLHPPSGLVQSPTCKATQSRSLGRLRRLRPPDVARISTENVWSFYLLEELPPALWPAMRDPILATNHLEDEETTWKQLDLQRILSTSNGSQTQSDLGDLP